MKNSEKNPGEKLIASNPSARAKYFIEEIVEAGIVLLGTEIKSLRNQSVNLKDSYVEISVSNSTLEAWLVNAHIAPYSHGNVWNHEPKRKRKLLLHRRQIVTLFDAFRQKGMAIIPTRMYFKKGRAKIEIGLGKGKKHHDKREAIKRRSAEKEMDRAMKRHR